jgi:hypothetical protein
VQAEGLKDTNTIARGDCAEGEATEQDEKDFAKLRARLALAGYSLARSGGEEVNGQFRATHWARSTSRYPCGGRGISLACRSSGMNRQHLDGNPRRFQPRAGQALTLESIRGPWRPSGTVAGASIFAVVWTTNRGDFWAALHDFQPADQLRLVDACRSLDREAGFMGAWPHGGAFA